MKALDAIVLATAFCSWRLPGAAGSDKSPTHLSELVEKLLHSKNYNSKIRPGADSEKPLVVDVNLHVTEIFHISEVDMEFSMTFYLRQKWQDKRLRYTLTNRSITLNYNQFNKIWTPDIFIRNLKAGHLHDITVPNRLIRLYPSGKILFSQRISVTLSCHMFLERYPMDNQTCHINFGSYAYTTDDILFYWDNSVLNPVVIKHTISFPKFDFNGVTHRVCHVDYAITGSYPCIEAFFHLKRRIKSYMLYVYLPSLLVVVLSWVSFWIDKESVPARISLGILTILTITTQSVGLNRNMPSVSFTKAIDVWLASCLVFVFAAFIEFAIVNVLSRRQKHRKRKNSFKDPPPLVPPHGKEMDLVAVNTALTSTVTTYPSSQVPTPEVRHRNSSGSHTSGNGVASTCCCSCKKERDSYQRHSHRAYKKKANWAVIVDITSRILFPLLFTVFNSFYWPYYILER